MKTRKKLRNTTHCTGTHLNGKAHQFVNRFRCEKAKVNTVYKLIEFVLRFLLISLE